MAQLETNPIPVRDLAADREKCKAYKDDVARLAPRIATISDNHELAIALADLIESAAGALTLIRRELRAEAKG